ncbi:hypothetical protein [Halorubrum sp. C191]|uniref:hypothetical protein n=1 Tax=Halorubrum sp. C191 TaxID=1383842 RepID=UPI0011817B23|nr:hypothetical protein [Halorubrum sp. C191]
MTSQSGVTMPGLERPRGRARTPIGDKYGFPWRFACIDCGSVNVVERSQSGFTTAEPPRFYCQECGTSADEVLDRKQRTRIGETEFEVIVDG